ncbi:MULTISPECIES: hypothetical protein [Myxococcus]|uniref:Uncharacterized protein n=1 Tax=Myxococcus xanthus TaxID=34 RepID=A0AAE6G494_MYXXA|nr:MULTISPECIES: hypothetical protein [Myxococcus]QDE70425.1 hypothetical protein BHS09_27590 [Myxococcus xanthus]QDE77705.1 hypothetical protein BHS08_27610 [Myxococcus xanthus]QDE85091.1 hypothetical protein BHS07_28155 [Myxococcus xanthus]QDE99247.1 hypothetical protein BHS05_27395 [Myxococcus xanthus]QDF06943.1 hypothetical protein BHS04_27700 [Myxococcus xanthus]
MARTTQEQTQERHAFLLDLFRQQPDISSKEALESFKDKFGGTINMKTFNQLREQAEDEAATAVAAAPAPAPAPEVEAEPEAEETEATGDDAASRLKAAAAAPEAINGAAGAPAKKAKAKGNGPKNIFVDAPKEHLTFLEGIIQQFQEAGAANIRIDHATDRWMVVVVDSK